VSSLGPIDIERIHHVSRELLRSRDLRDMLDTDAELQWWHQRAAHDSFGIAEGFEVGLSVDEGFVAVAPGLAFDCFGRDVHLSESRVVPVPEGDERVTLLARLPHERRRLDRGCDCSALGRSEAELAWLGSSHVDARAGVPLARFDRERSPKLQPNVARARSLARPRIGAGATPRDGTPWQPFGGFGTRRVAFGVEVRVDTHAVGFTDTPCYFAWLQWPHVGSWTQSSPLPLELGLQYIERSTIDGFTFRVWLDVIGRASGDEVLALAHRQQLFVSWLGVETEHDMRAKPHGRKKP
jgi:hypothetical protein